MPPRPKVLSPVPDAPTTMLEAKKHRVMWQIATHKITLPALVLVLAAVFGTVTQHVGVEAREEERRELDEPSVPAGDEFDFAAAGNSDRTLSSDTYIRKPESVYSSCPDGYPTFGKLGEMLRAWSPNEPDVPEGGVIERLQVSAQHTLRYLVVFLVAR